MGLWIRKKKGIRREDKLTRCWNLLNPFKDSGRALILDGN